MTTTPSPLARFFGYAMIAVGVVISLSSGACTLAFLASYLQSRREWGMIWLPPMIGGPFILSGIVLIIQGRSMSRRRGPPTPPEDVF